jgi:cyclophilin family peptidyl-prolyl cis-trans isomerase
VGDRPAGDPAGEPSKDEVLQVTDRTGRSLESTLRGRPRWRRLALCLAPALLVLALASGAAAQTIPRIPGCELDEEIVPVPDETMVRVETPLGTIVLELYSNVAPETVANFLGYIERGDYENTIVHRVTSPPFVIQMGGYAFSGIDFFEIETQPPIPNEPCFSNIAGTIAMAKVGNDPDSATSQWFVNLMDNGNLNTQNGGFTVFGRVIEGFEVAQAINAVTGRPTDALPPYLALVDASLFSIFQETPTLATIDVSGTGGGCFDAMTSGVLLAENPVGPLDLEPSAEYDWPFIPVAPSCDTAGAGAGSPVVSCNDPGRRVILIDPTTGALVPDAGAPFGFAEALVSCNGLAASDAGFLTYLEGLSPQLDAALIRTSYTRIPEPAAGVSGACALFTVAALARRGRRGRTSAQPRPDGPSMSSGRTQAS